jgi:membrane protease YdiL (CAAX protease family)
MAVPEIDGRKRSAGRWPGPTARAQRWTVRYALASLVVALVTAGGLAVALAGVGVTLPRGPGVLVIDAMFLATLVPLYRSGSLRPIDLGLRPVPGARSVGLVLLGLIIYGWSSALWSSWVHPPPVHSTFAGVGQQSTIVIVLTGFAAAVSAPVVEEIFFRGFLYRSLRNRMGVTLACLIVGAVFGLGHTQYPLSVRPVLAAFSVITCLLYERTGSLLPGIAMHSFIDASGFEYALSGRSTVVLAVFALLALGLLALAFIRRLEALIKRPRTSNESTLQRIRRERRAGTLPPSAQTTGDTTPPDTRACVAAAHAGRETSAPEMSGEQMSAHEEHPSEPVPEPEGVGEGAEYEIAEGDEQEDGAPGGEDHPDRKSPRGDPATEQSDVDEGIEKLKEISGN